MTHRSGVFVNKTDFKTRFDQNYQAGWQHFHGDLIVYQPAFPFRDEGLSFYTFYYDALLKQEKLQQRAANNATVQYWTPNKRIFNFDYANNVALEECRKRNIEVNFGWELVKVHQNAQGENWGTFRNVDNGKTIEKNFNQLVAQPPSRPHKEVANGPLVDAQGLIDVNPYTLQHKKYENVFAFGSCANVPTTSSHYATMAQCGIVKHNVQRYLHGEDLNAVYDGYSHISLWLGTMNMTSFQHYYN
jgi:sulfide:quinone oxidoreductase